jgi:hypothetical protein
MQMCKLVQLILINKSCIFVIMKFVLEVKESRAATLLAPLNNLPYVKTKPLTPYKAKF